MAEKPNPRSIVGLEHHAPSEIEYVEFSQPSGQERKIKYKGAYYEHHAEDADGVWLYRRVDF